MDIFEISTGGFLNASPPRVASGNSLILLSGNAPKGFFGNTPEVSFANPSEVCFSKFLNLPGIMHGNHSIFFYKSYISSFWESFRNAF